jgi:hypothetical protein
MSYEYVDTIVREGDLIVQVVADMNPSSPRENDNFTVIYGSHRNYTIGDGEPPSDEMRVLERGGIRLLYRWLRRYKDIVAFSKLGMYDHSNVSYYPVEIGENGHAAFDEAGWDSGVVGYAYITRKRWIELNGDSDPLELVDAKNTWPHGIGDQNGKMTWAMHRIEAEIEEYSDWASGNVWGWVVTKLCDHPDTHDSDEAIAACPHSEHLDSCWGYIGEPKYALEEGIRVAKWSNEHEQVSMYG